MVDRWLQIRVVVVWRFELARFLLLLVLLRLLQAILSICIFVDLHLWIVHIREIVPRGRLLICILLLNLRSTLLVLGLQFEILQLPERIPRRTMRFVIFFEAVVQSE